MELSERLKALIREADSSSAGPKFRREVAKLFITVRDNLPEILAALDSSEHKAKCVQFAEDVEKLRESMVPFSMYPQTDGSVFIVIRLLNEDKEFHSPDIYTAARKAVEALRAAKEGA